jgi:hypothetical protein
VQGACQLLVEAELSCTRCRRFEYALTLVEVPAVAVRVTQPVELGQEQGLGAGLLVQRQRLLVVGDSTVEVAPAPRDAGQPAQRRAQLVRIVLHTALRLGVYVWNPGDPITLGADRSLRAVDVRDQGDDEPTALVLSVVGLVAASARCASASSAASARRSLHVRTRGKRAARVPARRDPNRPQGSARGLEPERHLTAEVTLSAELRVTLPIVGG